MQFWPAGNKQGNLGRYPAGLTAVKKPTKFLKPAILAVNRLRGQVHGYARVHGGANALMFMNWVSCTCDLLCSII